MERYLLLTLGLGLLASPTYALNIDIPGADSHINKDAYMNYRQDNVKTRNMERDIEFTLTKDKTKSVLGDALVASKYQIYTNQELNHAMFHSSSVFILKNDGANVKFTIPVPSGYGRVKYMSPNSTIFKLATIFSRDTSVVYEIHRQPKGTNWETTSIPYNSLTTEDIKTRAAQRYGAFSESGNRFYGGTFSYPTVEKATWDTIVYTTKPTMASINFTMKETPRLSYHIAFSYTKKKEKQVQHSDTNDSDIVFSHMYPLVNYVLPSIEPAKAVLSQSKSFPLYSYIFRIMNDTDVKLEGNSKNGVYIYKGAGYTEGIIFGPIHEAEQQDHERIFPKLLRDFIDNEEYTAMKPVQYATVWNDAIPSIYMEVQRPHSKLFMQSTHDDVNVYTHFITKDDVSPLRDKDIRDVIQYVEDKTGQKYDDVEKTGLAAVPPKSMVTFDIPSKR